MADELEDLRERLRAYLAAQETRGAHQRVAEALGVSKVTLSHWVNRRRYPSARDALRLREFLQRHRIRRPTTVA